MRSRLVIAAAVALALGAGWWWRGREAPGGTAPETDAQAQARERFEKLRAQLNAMPSAPLPPPSGALEIGGQVVGPGGPLPGATVTATRAEPRETLTELPCPSGARGARTLLDSRCFDGRRQLAELVAERRGEAQPVARATADAEGRFTLRGLVAGTYALWADAPQGVGVKPGVAAGTGGNVISVSPGETLRGRVVDARGPPIEGAVVTAVCADQARFFDAVSGPGGRVALGPVPRGPCFVIGLSGSLMPDLERLSPWDRGPFTLTLHAPRRLRGQVLHGDGPAAGAEVLVEADAFERRLRADREGRFELERLAPGDYLLKAHLGALLASSARVSVPAFEDPAEVSLQLHAAGTLAGAVRSEAGAAVAGAVVQYRSDDVGRDQGTLSTGPDGTFRVEAVAPGDYVLQVVAKGFESAAARRCTVRPGETATVEIALHPVPLVEGTVLDPDGAPLPGATIRVPGLALDSPPVSDERGHFAFDGLPAGTTTLEVDHPDFEVTSAKVQVPSNGVVIRLGRGLTLDGKVLGDSGAPVDGAHVRARVEGASGAEADEGPSNGRAATTDVTGAFHLRGLQAGQVTLVTTRSSAYWREWPHQKVVEVPSPSPVVIQLPPAGRIAGRVVDSGGHPLSAVVVEAEPSEDTVARVPSAALVLVPAKTGDQGTFELSGLELGEYRLSGSLEGYDGAEALARTGDRAVELVLKWRQVVRGRVLGPGGVPVTSFSVEGRHLQDPGGEFHVLREPDQEMVIRIEADAPELELAVRTVPPGQGDYALGDTALKRGRRLAGRVVDAGTGAAVEGAFIFRAAPPMTKVSVQPFDLHPVRSRADGSFEITLAGEPPSGLSVQHPDYDTASVPVPEQGALEVRLERSGRIVGDVQGSFAGSLRVIAARADLSAPGYGNVEGDGHFVIRGLKPGTYFVRADQGWNHTVLPVQATIPEHGDAHVTLVLRDGAATLHVRVRGAGPDDEARVLLVPGARAVPATFEELMADCLSSLAPPEKGEPLEFQHVPPGAYTLFAMLVDREKARVSSAPVTVGEQEQTVEIAAPTGARPISRPSNTP